MHTKGSTEVPDAEGNAQQKKVKFDTQLTEPGLTLRMEIFNLKFSIEHLYLLIWPLNVLTNG